MVCADVKRGSCSEPDLCCYFVYPRILISTNIQTCADVLNYSISVSTVLVARECRA